LEREALASQSEAKPTGSNPALLDLFAPAITSEEVTVLV